MAKNSPNNQVIAAAHYSGPLPPPNLIEKYEKILPGSAERIFKMAENQADHRRSLETKYIYSTSIDARLGLILGFIIVLLSIGCSVWLLFLDKITSGLSLGIGSLATLSGVFIYGTRVSKK